MIFAEEGHVILSGTGVTIYADLGCIVEDFYTSLVKSDVPEEEVQCIISDVVVTACSNGAKRIAEENKDEPNN